MPDLEAREQNLRFQGQYLDRDTGLHYNTFRYYDPDIGRFISPDPIGLNGGINLWRYTINPIMRADPLGWADLFDIGTYGSLNSNPHVGDGLQAHELIRHEWLQRQGLANEARLSGNPSIALDLDHHTRGPMKDTRGIGGVHYHETQVRIERGLSGYNDLTSSINSELSISIEAMKRAGIPRDRIASLARAARKFHSSLVETKAKVGC